MRTIVPIMLERVRREGRVLQATLRATAAVFPISAALSTIVAYSVLEALNFWAEQGAAIAIGAVVALCTWLIVAFYSRGAAGADSASPRNYTRLCERADQLQSQLKHLCPELISSAQEMPRNEVDQTTRNEAYEQALSNFREIKKGLKGKGMPWITGTGYIELWHRMHRAEEALTMLQSISQVITGAMRDETRLVRSNMINSESLRKRLRDAVAMLDDSTEEQGDTDTRANKYLRKPLGNATAKLNAMLTGPTEEQGGTDTRADNSTIGRGTHYLTEPAESPLQWNPAKARTILRAVRYEINSFRDDVWEGIVHARNRLAITSVLLAFAAYVLLVVAIIAKASPDTLLWATAYFLVGALIGLFARAQAEANADTAVDDFGLSTTRLINVPVFSGLGALGGVVVAAVIDSQFLAHRGGESNPNNVMTLAEIFTNRPSLIVVAAIFGLTPDLVIRRLAQQSDRYKEDLQSTETTQSTETNQGIETSQRR